MIRNIARQFASIAFLMMIAAQAFAETKAVTGEVVETYCWAVHQVGGTGHAQCGIECAKRGLPVALYDAKTRLGYILLPGRDKTSLPPELVAAMGQRVTIRGETMERGGLRFLIIQSWSK